MRNPSWKPKPSWWTCNICRQLANKCRHETQRKRKAQLRPAETTKGSR